MSYVTKNKGNILAKNTNINTSIKKSNASLRKHDDRTAGEWLAKSTAYGNVVGLVENYKKELSDKKGAS